MTRFLPHPKRLKCAFIMAASVAILFHGANSFADSTSTAEWNISADKITRFEDPESIIAEGNIVLKKREKIPPKQKVKDTETSSWAALLEEKVVPVETTPADIPENQKPKYETKVIIKADWIAYDLEKESIRARGNVSIDTGDDVLKSEEADISLATETGSFTNATINRKDLDLHLEGKKIEKTGVKTYRIEDGWVITCKIGEGEVPPWSFSASETTIEQGGYAVLKNAKFNIKQVPVFWFPYMVVPVKNTRQSGFILPELSTSNRDGFAFNVPYFWSISDSTDMTFFAHYLTDRGAMPGFEFRYAIDTQNKGQLMADYLKDDLSDPENEPEYYADTGFTHTNDDRYWIRGKVDQDFDNNWITRLDVDVVSDRDYLTEFSSGLTGFDDTHKNYLKTFGRGFENQDDDQRQNRLGILKSWQGSTLNIDLLAINDVRAIESSPTPLWQLPNVVYSGAQPIFETPLTFEWDSSYAYFWRDEGIGGHRLDLFPRLSAPVPVGPYLESRAELGGRGTVYSVDEFGDSEFDQDDTPSRFLATFHTELATTLVKDFSFSKEGASYLTHSVRPFIEYDYISEDDDDVLPDFDSIDNIDALNGITYGVDSFLNIYDQEDNYKRQYAYFRIDQAYDLGDVFEEDFTPVNIKLGWLPLRDLWFAYKAEIPIEEQDFSVHAIEGYFSNSRGDVFGAEYRYNEEGDIEQLNGYLKARILPVLDAEFKIEHSLSESETNEGIVALTYLAQCWSVQLKGEYRPTDERVMLMFNLANIGSPLPIKFQ